MASGIEQNTFSTEQILHLECLVNLKLVYALLGYPAEGLVDEFRIEPTLRTTLLFESYGLSEGSFVSRWE